MHTPKLPLKHVSAKPVAFWMDHFVEKKPGSSAVILNAVGVAVPDA